MSLINLFVFLGGGHCSSELLGSCPWPFAYGVRGAEDSYRNVGVGVGVVGVGVAGVGVAGVGVVGVGVVGGRVVGVNFYSPAQPVRGSYPQRPSGLAVVTGVFPSPLRYLPSILSRKYRVQRAHLSAFYARGFASNFANSHTLALSARRFVRALRGIRTYDLDVKSYAY